MTAPASIRPGDRPHPGGRTRGLAMFGPLPPLRNGIGDYGHELLGPLRQRFDVTAVIAANAPDPVLTGPAAGTRWMRAPAYDAAVLASADLAAATPVYQVGNNPDHVFLLKRLLKRPGVLVLHDFNTSYLIEQATSGQDQPEAVSTVFAQELGARGLRLHRDGFHAGIGVHGLQQDLALNAALIEAAGAVIVHSQYAAARLRARFPRVPVIVSPHHVSPAILERQWVQPAAARRRLSLPERAFIALSIGFVNEAKQIPLALEALARARPVGQDVFFVVAGDSNAQQIDLKAAAERAGLSDRLLLRGYIQEHEFADYIRAADLVFNLRHPYHGETSGTLTRTLALDAVAVVTDVGAFAEIPDGCAVKTRMGPDPAGGIAEAIAPLMADPDVRRAMGETAGRWMRDHGAIDRSLDAYEEAVAAVHGRTGSPPRAARRAGQLLVAPVPAEAAAAAARLSERLGVSAHGLQAAPMPVDRAMALEGSVRAETWSAQGDLADVVAALLDFTGTPSGVTTALTSGISAPDAGLPAGPHASGLILAWTMAGWAASRDRILARLRQAERGTALLVYLEDQSPTVLEEGTAELSGLLEELGWMARWTSPVVWSETRATCVWLAHLQRIANLAFSDDVG